ncbi:MAG: hypothetical protein JOZ69_13285 [Myxococcales bacterium]|nr:hypothetical protein [Myxococcales bacterium]
MFAADRASVGEPFGSVQALASAAAYAAPDGLSLAPDGLALLVVRADRAALAQVTRSSRSGLFGDPDETPYKQINSGVAPSRTSMVGPLFTYLGDPVLGQDGLTLMYSGYGGPMGTPGTVSIYETQRASPQSAFPFMTTQDGVGPLGVVHAPGNTGSCGTCDSGIDAQPDDSSAGVDASAAIEARRHPTGLSSDGRTVFYWDSLAPGAGRAAWRASSLAQFQSSTVLGDDWHSIVTNASCTRLYFVEQGEFRVAQIVP